MLVPYTKEDLMVLKNIVDLFNGKLLPRESNLLHVLKLSLEAIEDPSYTADTLFEDLIHTAESEWLDDKYTLVAHVLNYPLESMPLLINHVKAPISIIAQWRLEIAK